MLAVCRSLDQSIELSRSLMERQHVPIYFHANSSVLLFYLLFFCLIMFGFYFLNLIPSADVLALNKVSYMLNRRYWFVAVNTKLLTYFSSVPSSRYS